MQANSDFKDLLKAFNESGVKYLIVGGYALMYYREPRFTNDFDVWTELSAENAQRVYCALSRFGAPLRGIAPGDFAIPGQIYQLGIEPNRIDILTALEGLDFHSAWQNRQEADFDGAKAWFIGRDDLIRNKRALGRAQDLIDADLLEGKREA